jgi:hypothetical protein
MPEGTTERNMRMETKQSLCFVVSHTPRLPSFLISSVQTFLGYPSLALIIQGQRVAYGNMPAVCSTRGQVSELGPRLNFMKSFVLSALC